MLLFQHTQTLGIFSVFISLLFYLKHNINYIKMVEFKNYNFAFRLITNQLCKLQVFSLSFFSDLIVIFRNYLNAIQTKKSQLNDFYSHVFVVGYYQILFFFLLLYRKSELNYYFLFDFILFSGGFVSGGGYAFCFRITSVINFHFFTSLYFRLKSFFEVDFSLLISKLTQEQHLFIKKC